MRRDEVLQILSEHRTELNHAGVGTLACFGSVARDEARVDSDIDLLVEFSSRPSFVRHMDLKFLLEACHPGVEWRNIAGLRDIVAHEDFGIDEDI